MICYLGITLLVLIGLIFAIIGLLFLILTPKNDNETRSRAVSGFISGMACIAVAFLIGNTEKLDIAEKQIGLTLVGIVIATISVINMLKK